MFVCLLQRFVCRTLEEGPPSSSENEELSPLAQDGRNYRSVLTCVGNVTMPTEESIREEPNCCHFPATNHLDR